ncbi:MAG: hypothetical protein U1E43_01655 [Rhodospirillales bacterium]
MSGETAGGETKRTPLYDLHVSLGARMVPFAGYEMPLHYPLGILAEHLQARAQAVLFDVSHMGQVRIDGDGAALEKLVVADVTGLAAGKVKYTLLTNEAGGIIDDLMPTPAGTHLMLVVNASRKAVDVAHLQKNLPGHEVRLLDDQALLALQGPAAAAVLARLVPAAKLMLFMSSETLRVGDIRCTVTAAAIPARTASR